MRCSSARTLLGLALLRVASVEGVGYFVGGPGAECFKYPENTHLQPCAALESGDLHIMWPPP